MIQDWNDPKHCLQAVKQNGLALRWVENQTPDICLEAVKQNGYALAFVINQTPLIIHYLKKYNITIYNVYKKKNQLTISDNEMIEFYNENPHLLLTL